MNKIDIKYGPYPSVSSLFFYSFNNISLEDGKIPINSANSMTIEQLDQESLSLELLMKQLLIEVPYSDVTFTVENQQIPAHKWWLMRKSKYFDKMFSSNFLCNFFVLKN